MRRASLLLTVAVTIGGCATEPQGAPDPTPVQTTPATTAESAPSVPTTAPFVAAPEPVAIEGCMSVQPRPWSLLCQAHDLVTANHIDTPDARSLAAAATAGVLQVAPPAGDESTGPVAAVTCVIPDIAYESVCDAVVDRHRLEQLSVESLVEGAVQGIFRFGLDPFSSYLAPDYADRVDALGSGFVFSLGLVVGARDQADHPCGPISAECVLSVLAVFDFSPAATAGVLVGDSVRAIDGSPTEGLSESEAVAALHADPGDTTRVTVDRPTGDVDKVLEHEDIRFDPVEFAMVTPSVGYLRVNDFSQEAAQLVGEVLSLPEMEGASGLVLDLRDNPGGLVMSARAIASQFLRSGLVAVEETRAGFLELPVIQGGLAAETLDVVVAVNAGTASAAEIVAAALQGQGRAEVVGERTFGKNLVQDIFAAPGGGEYRITVARWQGPGGIDVGRGGLQPDHLVEAVAGHDAVLDFAFELLGLAG